MMEVRAVIQATINSLQVILIMYNLLSLNWHVSVSQNNYTSKQGLCCSHCFMYLMLIQTVKLKLESDMSYLQGMW